MEKVLGPEDPATLDAALGLGLAYVELGKFAEAELQLDRTLRRMEKVRGPEDPYVIYLLQHVARLKGKGKTRKGGAVA